MRRSVLSNIFLIIDFKAIELMFFFLFGVSLWNSSWKSDIFPISHGGYYVGDNGEIQNYQFWNAVSTYLFDFSLFSNGDLYFNYKINVK